MSDALKEIQTDLDTADAYVRNAGKVAKRAGDADGARKCSKQSESIRELRRDFDKKGK